MRRLGKKIVKDQRGAALVEFAIAATIFLTVTFAVIEFGYLLWIHNALTDAARRGARYAVTHAKTDASAVQNVAVYGDPAGSTQPLVNNLTTANVNVQYSPDFGLNAGRVSVSIQNYQYRFVLPILGTTLNMPAYTTTLTGENVGLIPPDR